MHWFLILLVLCLGLSLLQYAVVALVLVLLISLLWRVYSRPAETFGLLGFLLFASVLMAHPLTVISFMALLALFGSLTSQANRQPEMPLPSAPDEEPCPPKP